MLQPLLLLMLLTGLLTLLYCGPVLLSGSGGRSRLEKLRDTLLVGRDIRQLVLLLH